MALILAAFVVQSVLMRPVAVAGGVQSRPLAMVYSGPGSCDSGTPDGCSESAARLAQHAGFQVIFVGPEGKEAEGFWEKAKLWIQPGGRARIQVLTMTAELKNKIRSFVSAGGGYVGFCAGGFLATQHFGWVDTEEPKNSFEADGLGLLPGNSRYYERFDGELTKEKLAKVIPTTWRGQRRSVYWELGPYFDASTIQNGVVLDASYEDGRGLAVRSHFGAGKVAVTAFHPEAPESWYRYYGLTDGDGVDHDIALEMMGWAGL